MKSKIGNIILIAMVAGAVLGALGGYFAGNVFLRIQFLGTIFLNALKMVVIPLIVASMIVGVASLGDVRRLGKTTGKTLLYYLATTGISVIIGLILVNVLRPGVGVSAFGSHIPDLVAANRGKTLIDVIVSLIPDNIFGAAAEGRVLPLIVASLVFGAVLTTIGVKGRSVLNFFDGLNRAIMKLVTLILYFAPIGVMALIGGIVAQNRGSIEQLVSGLGMYTLTVLIGLAIHAIIILPLILKMFTGKSPFTYFVNMGQALATAFTTASSSATLPITIDSVEEKNKVNPKAASFVLPLGATINMDGTALYEAVAAMFIAQIYGVHLSLGGQIIIFLTATLASIGAAGIPHAGTVTMVFVLSAVGLPLEGIGLIWAIDWFLDRCRTTVNVWGDSIGAAVIGETSEMKEESHSSGRKTTSSSRTDTRDRSRSDRSHGKYERKDRPSSRQSSGDSRKRYGSRDRDDRRSRSSRPDRPDRPDRSNRPDRSDKRSRPDNGRSRSSKYNHKPESAAPKPVQKPESRSNKEPKEILGPDLKVKLTPEPVKPSKTTIERELEKVRQQLDKMDDKDTGVVSEKPPVEKGNSDSYFDIDISKLNLLGDAESDKPEAPHKAEKPKDKPEPKEPEKLQNKPEPKEPEKPEVSKEEKADEKKQHEDDEESESSDDNMWGRGKKKKLMK